MTFPDIPKQYLPDFIRGYFDGDGSVYTISYKATKNKKIYTEIRSNFTSGSKRFLQQLESILVKHVSLSRRIICQFGKHQFKFRLQSKKYLFIDEIHVLFWSPDLVGEKTPISFSFRRKI